MTEQRHHWWTALDRLLLVSTLLGAAFSAGYNYRGLDAIAAEMRALQVQTAEGFSDVQANYLRKDVAEADQRRIDEQLQLIRIQLDRIEGAMR